MEPTGVILCSVWCRKASSTLFVSHGLRLHCHPTHCPPFGVPLFLEEGGGEGWITHTNSIPSPP